MQEQMQKQMAEMRVEATAGGGMVTVVVNGSKQLQSLRIDPEVVSKDDVEMLQDLIARGRQRRTSQSRRAARTVDVGYARWPEDSRTLLKLSMSNPNSQGTNSQVSSLTLLGVGSWNHESRFGVDVRVTSRSSRQARRAAAEAARHRRQERPASGLSHPEDIRARTPNISATPSATSRSASPTARRATTSPTPTRARSAPAPRATSV